MSAALALLAISLTFIVPAGMFAATVTSAGSTASTSGRRAPAGSRSRA